MADKEVKRYDLKQPGEVPLTRTKTQNKYFFLDDVLYRTVRENRVEDMSTCWNYVENKYEKFVLSDLKQRMKMAYDTADVSKLLNRKPAVLLNHIGKGMINPPIKIHQKGRTTQGKPFGTYKWRDADIFAMHEYMISAGHGRPRKDGTMGPPARLPSRRELRAMMNQQTMFYMKGPNGEMIPVWQARDGIV